MMKTPKYPSRIRNTSAPLSSYANPSPYQPHSMHDSFNPLHRNNGYHQESLQRTHNSPPPPHARFSKRDLMNYNKFSFERVKRRFNLNELQKDLFPNVEPLTPSDWLQETFSITADLPKKTEKERTEFILLPILLELRRLNEGFFTIYSGEFFNVEPREGLAGPTDFILSLSPESYSISSPIMTIVQAYKNNIDLGLGKCVAQMIAADIFNEREDNQISTVYGCVTTGEQWLFLRLEGDTIYIDAHRYFVNEIESILGVFRNIIDSYKYKGA